MEGGSIGNVRRTSVNVQKTQPVSDATYVIHHRANETKSSGQEQRVLRCKTENNFDVLDKRGSMQGLSIYDWLDGLDFHVEKPND